MPEQVNNPKLGMKLGKSPWEIQEGEYLFALNSEIQTSAGNLISLSNSPSNLLCSRFKDGYKVVGSPLPVISLNITFWFLHNPLTGGSEIGVIKNTFNKDGKDLQVDCKDCVKQLLLDKPLEETTQYPTCEYTTFVNADCLGFSLDNPIKSWAKVDDCDVTIYFVQRDQPLRYIHYPDFQKENYITSDGDLTCPPIPLSSLDCDKIKIFKDACSPTIEFIDVVSGGQNTAGVLQFAVEYSDAYGNPVTNPFYFTNKIDIWDKSKTVTTITDYIVNKSVKLHIEGLNTDFEWFNLVVLKTVNNVTTPFLVGTFSNSATTFDYTYSGIDKNLKENLSLEEALSRRPVYDSAELITESNGYSFATILTEPRIINLQPVINNLNVFWETVELNEGDYANPVLASKYQSFLRDEVYALAIEFLFENTNKTARFHIPGRSPSGHDLEDVSLTPSGYPNPDVFHNSFCNPSGDYLRWQVYNTASPSGVACDYDPTTQTNTQSVTFDCPNNTFYYQAVNTASPDTYYEDYDSVTNTLSNAVTDICEEPLGCNCASPSGDCLAQIEAQYPDADISSCSCSIQQMEWGQEKQINVYNPSGDLVAAPPFAVAPNPNPNILCINAIDYSENPSGASLNDCNDPYLAGIKNDGVTAESTWYSFTATTDAQQFNIMSIYNMTEGHNFVVKLYSSATGFCSANVLVETQTQNTSYFLFQDLTAGIKYFIEVTTQIIAPITAGVDNYYFICSFVPIPVNQITITTPNAFRLVCTYTIEYTTSWTKCNALVYDYGKMGYWQSTETYPCNKEVWGDLAGLPIRHHKLPDCKTSPHFKNTTGSTGAQSLFYTQNKIYPLGLRINAEDIKNLLQDAVNQGLITQEEKLSICGYRILRGNRRGNESIIGKGILYDVWKYTDNVYESNPKQDVLYPNYPYNSREEDVFINRTKITNRFEAATPNGILHPNVDNSYNNNKYVLHGANFSYNNPGLGSELKLELEVYGSARGRFSEVTEHAKYQYVGNGMLQAALGFASVEASVETILIMLQAFQGTSPTVLGTGLGSVPALIMAAISANLSAPGLILTHYYEWLELFSKFAPRRNYNWYHTSEGKYTDYTTQNIIEGNIRRGLNSAEYLTQGILSVRDDTTLKRFNNFKRESSVYLNLNNVVSAVSVYSTFLATSIVDNSRWLPNDGTTGTDNCFIGELYRNISSYYAAIKNNLPNQYGQVDQIEYVDTGYNGTIDWSVVQDTTCDPIFGGDTFICRDWHRRQLPLFLQDRVGSPPNTDILYNELGNVGYPIYFMNYPASAENGTGAGAIFGEVAIKGNTQCDYNFACEGDSGDALYQSGLALGIISAAGAGGAGVFMVPITYAILAASAAISTGGQNPVFIKGKMFNYVYGEPGFITESDYNLDLRYATNQKEGNFYPNVGDMVTWTQPNANFNLIDYDNTYNYNRGYSKQNKENFGFVLEPNFTQAKSDCKVLHPNRTIYSLQDIDNNDRFDGNLIFLANNYHDFPKSAGKVTNLIGASNNRVLVLQENQASVFNSYITLQTSLGTAAVGSNTLFSQTPVQYLKTDLGYGGSQTSAYTSTDYGIFYADNKRGKIFSYFDQLTNIIPETEAMWFKENLPFQIQNYFPDYSVDNPLKGAGMVISWDDRLKKVLFSKKDYIPKPEFVNDITFDGINFHYEDLIIFPNDEKFFCNKSWTLGYSPITKTFISFYSFIPDFYNSLPQYYQSGFNSIDGASLWGHNLTNRSYTVFYGEKYPWLFDIGLQNKGVNQQLSNIYFYTEVRRWQDNLNYGINKDKTFDYALIYTASAISSPLELIVKQKNNLYQWSQFNSGKVVGNKTQILTELVDTHWSFNTFYNISNNNGLPLMEYPCNQPYMKEVNPDAVSYKPKFMPTGFYEDYYTIRLGNTKDSQFQFVTKPIVSTQNPIV